MIFPHFISVYSRVPLHPLFLLHFVIFPLYLTFIRWWMMIPIFWIFPRAKGAEVILLFIIIFFHLVLQFWVSILFLTFSDSLGNCKCYFIRWFSHHCPVLYWALLFPHPLHIRSSEQTYLFGVTTLWFYIFYVLFILTTNGICLAFLAWHLLCTAGLSTCLLMKGRMSMTHILMLMSKMERG